MNEKNIAYIDASNLKFGVEYLGWKLDYKAFRSWLRDKYGVERAILFMGLVPEYADLYNQLQRLGYDVAFKPTLRTKEGVIKGNVDGELILNIVEDFYEKDVTKVILVSGDGDYACVIDFLKRKNSQVVIVAPNRKYTSIFLRKSGVPITFLDDLSGKLSIKKDSKKKKPPDTP